MSFFTRSHGSCEKSGLKLSSAPRCPKPPHAQDLARPDTLCPARLSPVTVTAPTPGGETRVAGAGGAEWESLRPCWGGCGGSVAGP